MAAINGLTRAAEVERIEATRSLESRERVKDAAVQDAEERRSDEVRLSAQAQETLAQRQQSENQADSENSGAQQQPDPNPQPSPVQDSPNEQVFRQAIEQYNKLSGPVEDAVG